MIVCGSRFLMYSPSGIFHLLGEVSPVISHTQVGVGPTRQIGRRMYILNSALTAQKKMLKRRMGVIIDKQAYSRWHGRQ